MTRYQNGKIYEIRTDFSEQVYIGSTCLPLAKRFFNHKKEERELSHCEGKLESLDLQTFYKYKNGRKRTTKTDKKGLIIYTYEQGKFKEISM